jgi:hypothetical protein
MPHQQSRVVSHDPPPSDLDQLDQGRLWACEADGKTPAILKPTTGTFVAVPPAVRTLELPDDPRALTRDDVRRYLASMRARDCSVATVTDNLKTLRIWLGWLVGEDMLRQNVASEVEMPRPDRKTPRTP